MGKYIIELERGETAYKTVNLNGTPLIQLLAPTPYTEDSAYAHGYTEAESKYREIRDELEKQAYQQGYEQGYKDGYNEPGKGKIQVGDEVNAPFGKAIVVNIDSVAKKIWLVYADGHGGFEYFKDAPTRTGRHFPEIAEVLANMKETDNG